MSTASVAAWPGLRPRLLDLVAAVLARLPLPLASLLGWAVAWTWWTVLPVRKAVAVENMARGLPEIPAGSRARHLRRMMHDLVLGYVELLHLLRDPARHRDLVALDGFDLVRPHTRAGRGCLVCEGHFGSWDLALVAAGLGADFPIACIVKPPTDPWAAALMERARRTGRITLLPPRGSMDAVHRLLSEGQVVLFTMDQRHNDGIVVDLLGRPARTAPSLAAAARRSGAPVFFVSQWREGTGRHRLRVRPAFDLRWTDDRDGDLRAATEAFNTALGEEIRRRPHGWLWLHRRWG